MNFSNLLNQVLGAVQQSGNKVMDEKNPLNSFGGGALIGGLASMLLKKAAPSRWSRPVRRPRWA